VIRVYAHAKKAVSRTARSSIASPISASHDRVAPDSIAEVVQSPGAPLGEGVRAAMEPRFGFDFSRVRIHADAAAAASARDVGARAYTVGPHIAFDDGQYSPETARGQRLLAHELTHVVQQGESADPSIVQRDLAVPPPAPDAVAQPLTPEQVQAAIAFNGARFDDPYAFAVLRDVVGVSRFPAVVDEEFVQAIAGWQAEHNLPQDGRLTARTTATLVAELRGEAALVPSLAADAAYVEAEPGLTFNRQQGYDGRTITVFQALVGAPTTGIWDVATIQRVMVWQRRQGLTVDGMVGPDTLRSLILELTASTLFDDAIHVIVNAFHFPTANLASIAFDATVTGADALTSGTIGTGNPQTVRVGPSTFAADYPHMIRIIGHELQHVQQRSGAAPITDSHVREFLSFAWEALAVGPPALAPADRVTHANIAINHWNQAGVAARTPHQAVRDRLDRLVAAGGVGNF
jgi:hypothetical protein